MNWFHTWIILVVGGAGPAKRGREALGEFGQRKEHDVNDRKGLCAGTET